MSCTIRDWKFATENLLWVSQFYLNISLQLLAFNHSKVRDYQLMDQTEFSCNARRVKISCAL